MQMAQGVGGVVLVGHRVAARLGLWRIDAVEGVMPQRFTIRAAVSFLDPFWSTRRPLSAHLHVRIGDGLTFAGLDPTFTNGALEVTTFEPPVDCTRSAA
jgi:hypothetical protein